MIKRFAVWGVGIFLFLLLWGCHPFRQAGQEGVTSDAPLHVIDLLRTPFRHGATVAEFRAELPTVRPTRMLYRPSRMQTEADTLYEFTLPHTSKIILYKSSTGQERFMAATIGVPDYRLRGGIHVGITRDSLRKALIGLPELEADTLKLRQEHAPYEVHFYFDAQRVKRLQILAIPTKSHP